MSNEVSRRIGKATRCPVHEKVRHYDIGLDRWACPVTGDEQCTPQHMTADEQENHPWLKYMEATVRRARLEDPT